MLISVHIWNLSDHQDTYIRQHLESPPNSSFSLSRFFYTGPLIDQRFGWAIALHHGNGQAKQNYACGWPNNKVLIHNPEAAGLEISKTPRAYIQWLDGLSEQ